MFKRPMIALACGLLAAAVALPAQAQNAVADFYKGRTIDVYVGLSAGGLYDINARLLARYMGRHIPGNPTLIARNMEGAAGLRLANWLYQVAPKDGTAMGTFARGIVFDPLLEQPGGLFAQAKKGDEDLNAMGERIKARKAELMVEKGGKKAN